MHVQILALGYKTAFSLLHMQGLTIFQNHLHIQNLQKLPAECMQTETSEFATQRQGSPLIFGTLKLVVVMTSTSLDDFGYVIEMLPVCFILCKQANLIE